MIREYEKIFSRIERPATPAGLLGRILARIEAEKGAIAVRKRIIWMSALSVASLPVMFFSWTNFQVGASQSGLFQIASLMFTDFSAIASHYQDFAMSIAESLPVLALAGLLAGALVFVESSLELIRDARTAYKLNF